MSLKNRLSNFCFGAWTDNRLLSRKWWLAAGSLLVVFVLDQVGRPFSDATLNFAQYVIVAYLAVQGAIDFFRYRELQRKRKDQDPGGDL
jgi:hypothetical protein